MGPRSRERPSTFFNGKSDAGGGGRMGNSQMKYDEYRTIIDKSLERSKRATIDVSATRAGDQIKIVASANLTEKGTSNKPKQVLRLALTEEAVHYVGSNKLRYHHHVVRALPGGTPGKELKDGTGKVEITLNLADVRNGLEEYLSDYEKTRSFPDHPSGHQIRSPGGGCVCAG